LKKTTLFKEVGLALKRSPGRVAKIPAAIRSLREDGNADYKTGAHSKGCRAVHVNLPHVEQPSERAKEGRRASWKGCLVVL